MTPKGYVGTHPHPLCSNPLLSEVDGRYLTCATCERAWDMRTGRALPIDAPPRRKPSRATRAPDGRRRAPPKP